MSNKGNNKLSERPTKPPGRDEATVYHKDDRSEYSGDGEKYIKMTPDGLFDFDFDCITEVKILDGTKYICDNAFEGCEHVHNVIIPNTVTHIGAEAFKKCGSIESIRIPDSVKVIGFQAFTECYSLSRFESDFASDDGRCLVINNVLVAVAPCGLEELYIPEGVNSIGNGVFAYCPNLKRIHFPNSLFKFPLNCFTQCKSLEVLFSKYSSEDHKCIIIDGKLILCIENKSEVYSVPEGVTTVGACAFCWNTTVREITLPSSIRTIETAAFTGCTKLTHINIPNGVEAIGYGAFEGCKSLKDIILPDSVTSIGATAFSRCTALKNIRLSNNLQSIEEETFRECSSLIHIAIPDSVITIGQSAFSGCKDLGSVILPKGLTIIENNVFYDCESLRQIALPSSLTTIKRRSFWGCKGLKEVSFSSSLETLEEYSFIYCRTLEVIDLSHCSKLDQIGREAFSCCSGIHIIELPDSLKIIKEEAFSYCSSLEYLVIPKSVKTIEGRAFGDCGMKYVRFLNANIEVSHYAFNFCRNFETVYIPEGTLCYFEPLFKSLSTIAFTGRMSFIEVGDSINDIKTKTRRILTDSFINKPLYQLGECNRHYNLTSERSYFVPDNGKTRRVDINVIIISCTSCTGCVRIGKNVVYNKAGDSWLQDDSHKCPYSEIVKAILDEVEGASANEKRYELLLFALKLLYKDIESKEIVIDETLMKVINYELSESVNKYWQYVGYSYGNDPPAPSSMSAPPGGTTGTTIELIKALIGLLGDYL